MSSITITKINRPLPQRSVWFGKASSSRRTYEWFYDHDRQRFWTRSRKPGSAFVGNIDRPPAALRQAAMIAIKQEQGR